MANKKEEVRFKRNKGIGYLLVKGGELVGIASSLNSARSRIANMQGKNFTIAKVEGLYTKVK